jgi:type VI secretion system Hcp family effector
METTMIVMRIDGAGPPPGRPGPGPGYDDSWIQLDSFHFGSDREVKVPPGKGKGGDISIGVGDLQDVTMTKSLDWSSTHLAQAAADGKAFQEVEIHFVETAGEGPLQPYLMWKLEPCAVKSWSISGDADDRPTEEVAFYYIRIAFSEVETAGPVFNWDRAKNASWSGHGLP